MHMKANLKQTGWRNVLQLSIRVATPSSSSSEANQWRNVLKHSQCLEAQIAATAHARVATQKQAGWCNVLQLSQSLNAEDQQW